MMNFASLRVHPWGEKMAIDVIQVLFGSRRSLRVALPPQVVDNFVGIEWQHRNIALGTKVDHRIVLCVFCTLAPLSRMRSIANVVWTETKMSDSFRCIEDHPKLANVFGTSVGFHQSLAGHIRISLYGGTHVRKV